MVADDSDEWDRMINIWGMVTSPIPLMHSLSIHHDRCLYTRHHSTDGFSIMSSVAMVMSRMIVCPDGFHIRSIMA